LIYSALNQKERITW